MKNRKSIGFLILELVTVGLAAAVHVPGWVDQSGDIASAKVVLPALDIEPGSRITSHLRPSGS